MSSAQFELERLSIRDLYPLALAEGEGVGTAYEYFAKRLELRRWLEKTPRPQSILVAGLPEKYGASLDFVQLALENRAEITVVDERPGSLEKLKQAMSASGQSQHRLHCSIAKNISEWQTSDQFDLALSSEVLQRLPEKGRRHYLEMLQKCASAIALFCPNGDNKDHTGISGLSGIGLEEMADLVQASLAADHRLEQLNYIDLPPFPPGITRTEDQREQATSGRFEALAMWGLGYFARLERYFPQNLRRKQAHIVFAFIAPRQR